MPRYEYECAKCEKVFEVTQKFSDEPLAQCPDCQGPIAKVFSQSSFALKGTGWYTTDYKRAGKSESAPAAPAAPAAKPAAK
jgi:putative FmdB family regulatory protein